MNENSFRRVYGEFESSDDSQDRKNERQKKKKYKNYINRPEVPSLKFPSLEDVSKDIRTFREQNRKDMEKSLSDRINQRILLLSDRNTSNRKKLLENETFLTERDKEMLPKPPKTRPTKRAWSGNKAREGKDGFEELGNRIKEVIESRMEMLDVYIGKDLKDGQHVQCLIDRKSYSYFRFRIPKFQCSIKVELEIMKGRMELFASLRHQNILLKENGKPSISKSHDQSQLWHINPSIGSRSLALQSRDFTLSSKYIYFTLYSHSPSSFLFKVTSFSDLKMKINRRAAAVLSKKVIQRRLFSRIQNLKSDEIAFKEFEEGVTTILKNKNKNINSENGRKAVYRNLDLRRFTPRYQTKRRVAWMEKHAEKLEKVKLKHQENEEKRRYDILKQIEKKARKREEYIRKLLMKEEMDKKKALVTKWITTLNFAKTILLWKNMLRKIRAGRRNYWKIIQSVISIQRFVRKYMEKKRKTRSRFFAHSLCSFVRFFANNFRIVRKHRAITVVKTFLENAAGVDPVSRVVQNFVRKVKLLQRFIKDRLAVTNAKMTAWSIQWDIVSHELVEEKQIQRVPPKKFKQMILKEYFKKLRKKVAAERQQYFHELSVFKHKLRLEQTKKIIGGSADVVKPPIKPHLPPVLPRSQMSALVKEAFRKGSEYMKKEEEIKQQIIKLEKTGQRRMKSSLLFTKKNH